MAKKRKKKKGRKKIVLFVFEILLLIILLLVLWFYNKTFGKMQFGDDLTDSEAGVNTDIDADTLENMTGYLNIALFGLDNRESGNYSGGNSDCIMVASINNETKEVQIVSVYRDTYLSTGSAKYTKANAAYAKGGVENAVKMLNSNLDLDITKYVCVDWRALVEVIDALGGVDINCTKAEVKEINFLLPEIDWVTGYGSAELSGSGMLHLNGPQAVAYARIRSTAGDDFLRASRQRIVIQAMVDGAKNASIGTLTDILFAVSDDISTNFSQTELVSLASNVTKYTIASTTGFPYDLTTADLSSTGSTVIPVDLESNVAQLHYYLFGETDYVASDTVKTISNKIANNTGITKNSETIDTTKYNETVGADGTEQTKEQNKEKKDDSQNSTDNNGGIN